MENYLNSLSNPALYLGQLLGKEASQEELLDFEHNQDLLRISRREPMNDSYRITFANCTDVQLLKNKVLRGGMLQLHSYEGNHRFYSVLFQERGEEEEHYLFLDATVETVLINGSYRELVQSVRLISVHELVLSYSPIMYSL